MFKRTLMDRFNALWMAEPMTGCWFWTGATSELGYGRFNNNNCCRNASRTAWELYRGPIPDGMFVCHHCDNRACVNPLHLFLGNQKDNMSDAARKNRVIRGSKHPLSKLSDTDIVLIKEDHRPLRVIASEFGIHFTIVKGIKKGKRWAHVQNGSQR